MERRMGESMQRQRLGRNVGELWLRRHDHDQDQALIMGNFNIPLELAAEILRRLPIKSLLRFTSVSKSWKSFIYSDYFIDLHLRRPAAVAGSDDDWLVAVLEPTFLTHMIVVEKATFTRLFEFENPPKRVRWELGFIGTCNGLLCIQALNGLEGCSALGECSTTCTRVVYLWNPVRGLKKVIDVQKFRGQSEISHLPFIEYGFGYDSRNNDYKVVKFQHQHHTNSDSSKLCFLASEVYSLSTNLWKPVLQSSSPLTSYPRPYFYGDSIQKGRPPLPLVNGAAHWLADNWCTRMLVDNVDFGDIDEDQLLERAEGINGSVISFSFQDMVFGELSLPTSSSTRCSALVSYKSLLAFMVPDHDTCDFDDTRNWTFNLWVMKEYGVADSWTKLYTICLPRFNTMVRDINFVRSRGFGEDEDEHVFNVLLPDPFDGFTTSALYFVKSICNSGQPTFTSSTGRILFESDYPITFRPSLVSFSTDDCFSFCESYEEYSSEEYSSEEETGA